MTGLASFFLDSSLINCRTMKFGVQIRLTSSNLGNGRVCDFMTEFFTLARLGCRLDTLIAE